ncbi:MAG: hypothetical protein VYA34_08665 [Myxococcota bacterium]|nr:hypothetical protein [Myxococcota bacterium]
MPTALVFVPGSILKNPRRWHQTKNQLEILCAEIFPKTAKSLMPFAKNSFQEVLEAALVLP